MSTISRADMEDMMAQVAADVAADPDPDEPYIRFITRRLDMEEITAFHAWLSSLPCFSWSVETKDRALKDLLVTRSMEVLLPSHMKQELMLAKLTWG